MSMLKLKKTFLLLPAAAVVADLLPGWMGFRGGLLGVDVSSHK